MRNIVRSKMRYRCRDLYIVRSFALLALLLLLPGQSNGQGMQGMQGETFTYTAFDQLEYTRADAENVLRWELTGWSGGDYNRLWVKSEGDIGIANQNGEGEVQVLYSRLVASFWEAQIGLRFDALRAGEKTDGRALLVVGLDGLAPYWFEVEPALFISHKGDLSARLSAVYDLRVTQRLIAQPRIELNAAVQRVPEFAIAEGINDLQLDLRLQYEFKREFAPYVGVSWVRKIGDAADLARRNGEDASAAVLVAGVRLWR